MIRQKPVSLADQVFERLEQDILSGVYPRNTILTELQLGADLGVSRTPIREAVRRLEQENIIETTAKGIRVLSITNDDIAAIYEIRTSVERLAAEACVMKISEEQLNHLRELLELQEFYVEKGNSEQMKTIDEDFHRTIYLACDTTVYYNIMNPLMAKIRKVRKTSLEDSDRARESCEEHRAILSAIESGNSKAAGEAMFIHSYNARKYAKKIRSKET